jgi:tRNA(adenine34) deaminase
MLVAIRLVLPPGSNPQAADWFSRCTEISSCITMPRVEEPQILQNSFSVAWRGATASRARSAGPGRERILMFSDEDEQWMRAAIEVATERGRNPSLSPIGAVIVLNGHAIAIERNRTEELCDATAHAEMMAFRKAGAAVGDTELRGAVLYSTLQPCGMCTMASIWSKVGRIVYGAGRDDVHRMYFEDRHFDTMNFVADAYRDDLILEGGCLRQKCAALYYGPDDDVPEEEQGNI